MAARVCPHCKSELTAPIVVAFTNGVDCPNCGTRLEVASGSREISTFAGLVAAALAWRMASGSTTDLGGVLPTLYAFLAFGIVSALVLMFTSNLRNAPALPAPEPVHASGGHGGGHEGGHDGGDHAPQH